MAHFKISNPWSGFTGIFEADDPDHALDVMARAMGYRDYQHAARTGQLDAFELLIERVSCEDILARLSEDDLEDLDGWRSIENADSVHLGGRGHTGWQIGAAKRAWDSLSPDAQSAYFSMRRSVVDDLIAAIQDVGIPDTDRDIDAITALLGHDHPAFRVLPAYALVDAYMEALEREDAEK